MGAEGRVAGTARHPGEAFNELETKLLALLRQLQAASADTAPLDAVLTMLEADYPAVYERLLDIMEEQMGGPALQHDARHTPPGRTLSDRPGFVHHRSRGYRPA